MKQNHWLRSILAILFMAGAIAAFAQKPAILAPTANQEIRGDNGDGNNFIRWTTSRVPGFIYTLRITPLDPNAAGNPGLAPAQVFLISPTDPTIVNEGNQTYRFPFDFNREELAQYGTGLFQVTLQATDLTFDQTSDPVRYYKGRPQASIGAIDGHNPDALVFNLSLDDPDSTPQYLYSVDFRQIDGTTPTTTTFGPFASQAAALSRVRSDFATFAESGLPQGKDYDLELRVTDTRPPTAVTKGLTSPLVSKRFHFNAKPVMQSIAGPAEFTFNPRPNNDPTPVPYTFVATDLDDSTVTLKIEISQRTDNTFANGGAFTEVVSTVIQTGGARVVFVPIPFTGTFWTVRSRVIDHLGIVSASTRQTNLTIDDVPVLGNILPRYASNNQPAADGHRFDFDLLSIAQPLGPNSGVVNAPINFQATGVIDTFFTPLSYAWDFGDGGTSTLAAPTHTYTRAAALNVTLKITDTFGKSDFLSYPVIINDKPTVEISAVKPGLFDADQDAFLAQLNSEAGAQVDIIWKRYNFVRSGDEDLNFNWDRSGSTIVCDRRGVANVETPTPGNLYFNPADTPHEVPDQAGITSIATVPVGERLGPITGVEIHNLDLQQLFNKPATNDAASAPTINVGVSPVNAAGATSDGFAPIDTASVTPGTDYCVAAPLLVPGTFNVNTASASADGFSLCDAATVLATNGCSTASLIAPGIQAINTASATADGASSADFTTVVLNNSANSAPAAAPGLINVDLTAATADGFSSCDVLSASEADLCGNAVSISPGTFPVSTAAASADGFSSADVAAVTGTDACAAPPAVAPGSQTVNTSAAVADGISTVEIGDPGANDTAALAPFVAPGTFAFNTAAAAADGLSSSDFTAVLADDACAGASLVSPGTLAVDVSTATADGFSTSDLLTALAADDCTSAPAIAPGTYAVDLSAALGDGASSADAAAATAAEDCASAPAIGPGIFTDVAGVTLDGVSSSDPVTTETLTDVFYSYTPRADGPVTMTLDTPTTGSVISVHNGCPATTVTETFSSFSTDVTNTLNLGTVTAGTTLIIRVARFTGDGNFQLTVDGPSARKDRFYLYTPQASGSATVTLGGSPTDAVLSVHSACPATLGNEIGSAVTSGTTQASVTFSVVAGTAYLVRLAGAVNDPDEDFNVTLTGPSIRKDVWFAYQPQASGNASFALAGSAADSVLSIHANCPGTIATAIDSSITTSGQATVLLPVVKGTTYLIRAAGPRDGSTPAFNVVVNGPGARKDRWLKYTPRANGTATLTLSGSAADTVLSVHSAAPGSLANEIDSTITTTTQASLTLPVTANTTYWIRGAGPKDDSDDIFNLALTGPGVRRDVFYAYTPRANGILNIALTGSPVDAVLSVHSACPATAANTIASGSSITNGSAQASVSLSVVANSTYLIRVAGPKDVSVQSFGMHIAGPGVRRDVYFAYTPRAAGNATFQLSNAVAGAVLSVHTGSCPVTSGTTQVQAKLTTGTQTSITFNAVNNTKYLIRIAEPMNASDQNFTFTLTGPNTRRDAWLAYTPRANGNLALALVGSPDDAEISVHSGRPGTVANTIQCDHTAGSTQASISTLPVVAGTTYYVRVASDMINADPTFQLMMAGPGVRKDVWYTYKPYASGTATVNLVGSPTDAVLSIHSGCPGTLANEIASQRTNGPTQASVNFSVTTGTLYYIRAAGPKDAVSQSFSLNLDGPGVRRDVWYRYTPVAAGNATFQINGSTNDAVLSVHSSCPGTAANDLGCARTTTASQALVSLPVTAGTSYYVRVAGPRNAVNQAFTLTVTGPNTRNDVWYAFNPGANGATTVTLQGSSPGTIVSVHSAAPGTVGNALAGAVTTSAGNQARAGFAAVAGNTYFIRFALPFGGTNPFSVLLAGPKPSEWIGDLHATLTSPHGTTIELFSGMCPTPNPAPGAFNLSDDAVTGILAACPPAAAGTYQPIGMFGDFVDESPTGNWTLTLTDGAKRNVGKLQGWSLQVCTKETVPAYNGNVTNTELFDFVATGTIPHLFKVTGVYDFTLNPPTEHFAGVNVTGAGDSKTIIVQEAGTLRNAADGWMLYR